MRKTSEEITREVFGQSARWIGWDNWLKHQPIFKYIEKKVEEGLSIMSTRHFMARRPMGAMAQDMIYVATNDRRTGPLRDAVRGRSGPYGVEPGVLRDHPKVQ